MCRRKAVGSKIIDGQAYLVSLDKTPDASDAFYSLNSTGTRIWSLINGQKDIGQIAEKISQEFSITKASAQKEVAGFVGCLRKKGLLAVKKV